jgi:hypothetical protein
MHFFLLIFAIFSSISWAATSADYDSRLSGQLRFADLTRSIAKSPPADSRVSVLSNPSLRPTFLEDAKYNDTVAKLWSGNVPLPPIEILKLSETKPAVAVIGGGPIGLITAITLFKSGAASRVYLIEKRKRYIREGSITLDFTSLGSKPKYAGCFLRQALGTNFWLANFTFDGMGDEKWRNFSISELEIYLAFVAQSFALMLPSRFRVLYGWELLPQASESDPITIKSDDQIMEIDVDNVVFADARNGIGRQIVGAKNYIWEFGPAYRLGAVLPEAFFDHDPKSALFLLKKPDKVHGDTPTWNVPHILEITSFNFEDSNLSGVSNNFSKTRNWTFDLSPDEYGEFTRSSSASEWVKEKLIRKLLKISWSHRLSLYMQSQLSESDFEEFSGLTKDLSVFDDGDYKVFAVKVVEALSDQPTLLSHAAVVLHRFPYLLKEREELIREHFRKTNVSISVYESGMCLSDVLARERVIRGKKIRTFLIGDAAYRSDPLIHPNNILAGVEGAQFLATALGSKSPIELYDRQFRDFFHSHAEHAKTKMAVAGFKAGSSLINQAILLDASIVSSAVATTPAAPSVARLSSSTESKEEIK